MKDFFKGVIFISLLIPLIEGIVSLYRQAIEFFCVKIAAKTYEVQQTIATEENKSETNVIGFTVNSEEIETYGGEGDSL